MSIWRMENGTFLEQYDSMDTAIKTGVPISDLYYVAGDESGFEVTSVQSWTVPLL